MFSAKLKPMIRWGTGIAPRPPERPTQMKAVAGRYFIPSARLAQKESGAMPLKVTMTATVSGPSLRDELTFPIECPKCGHEIPQTLAQLKDNPVLVCSACGENVQVTSDAATREAAEQVDNIDRAWDKLAKG